MDKTQNEPKFKHSKITLTMELNLRHSKHKRPLVVFFNNLIKYFTIVQMNSVMDVFRPHISHPYISILMIYIYQTG